MSGSIFAYSLPNFRRGLLLILLFAVQLRWFPLGKRGETGQVLGIETSLVTANGWTHIFLPAVNLALFNAAMAIRLTRAQVQAAMNSPRQGHPSAPHPDPPRLSQRDDPAGHGTIC